MRNSPAQRVQLIQGDFLDPRPADQARCTPLARAANIPADQLADRTHELPPRSTIIRVIGPPDVAQAAVARLAELERRAEYAGAGWCDRSGMDEGDLAQGSDGRRGAGACAGELSSSAIYRLWCPNAFLERVSAHLAPGTALDLACGVGRDAVYLASLRWRAVGVDLLPDALERAQRLADGCAAAIVRPEWRCADLTDDATLDGLGRFDLVICFRYLNRRLLSRISERLAPGGALLVETFTTMHRERHGRPRRAGLALELGELRGLAPGLEVVEYDEGWREDVHTARLWARRSARTA
ncbi:MAG: class I SAM-dependent methyltransferase [Planctomycetia bacterium]|nr:MAG: class I SAM-dependent methyltransferase [Planctomycetia bacterium]